MLPRRTLSGAALALPMIMGSARSVRADANTVRISQSIDGFIYGPLYIARAGGALQRQGVTAEVIISGGGSKAMTAMVAGSVDIYVGAPFELINLVQQHKKALAFATLMTARPSQIIIRQAYADKIGVRADSPLDQRIRALGGARLGVSSAKSSGDGLMRYFLKRGGFNPDRDAEIVPLGDAAAAVATFGSGQVDIMSFTSPVIEQALARTPSFVLIDLVHGEIAEYRNYPFICLIARQDWLEANRPLVSGVIRALAEAETYLHDNKQAARALLRPYFPKLEESLFDASYETNFPGYATTPTVVPQNFEMAFREFNLAADHPTVVTPDQIASNAYVAAALAK